MDYKIASSHKLKMLDDDGVGEFSAYASTFGNFDDVGERPVRGAFASHLDSFLRDGFIAFGHAWHALPIATPVEAKEDDYGLFIKAAFHSTPEAQAVRTMMSERLARGKSVKTSIGYEVLADEYNEQGRLLKDIKLFEVSVVTVPANPLADVIAAKGAATALGFVEHSEAVVSAVEEFTRRAKDRQAFRAKEGRVLSDANRKKIASLLDSLTSVQQELGDLLAATEPKADPETAKQLYLDYQRTLAVLNGVMTP